MDESGGYLRVCFEDESWITIGAQSNSTAKQVCESIAKKRNLRVDAQNCFALFACEFSDDNLFERRLDDDELPVEIYDSARVHGHLNAFRFNFKRVPASANQVADGNSSGSDDEFFSQSQRMDQCERMGYMEKRGETNTAWRDRWFVLQGQQLFYFKSHEHSKPITFIPLENCFVSEAVPAVVAGQSVSTPNSVDSHIAAYHRAGGVDANSLPMNQRRGSDFVFYIDTKQRLYQLRCRTQSDMKAWLQDLRRATRQPPVDLAIIDASTDIEAAEWRRSMANQQVESWLRSSFEGLLGHPTAIAHFRNFLHEQHCEDLSFWLEAQQYRDRSFSNEGERVQYATTIFELFMANNASFKISAESIPAASIESDCNRCCFLSAQKQIFQQLKCESFPQFLESPHFIRCLLTAPPSSMMSATIYCSESNSFIPISTASTSSQAISWSATPVPQKLAPESLFKFEATFSQIQNSFQKSFGTHLCSRAGLPVSAAPVLGASGLTSSFSPIMSELRTTYDHIDDQQSESASGWSRSVLALAVPSSFNSSSPDLQHIAAAVLQRQQIQSHSSSTESLVVVVPSITIPAAATTSNNVTPVVDAVTPTIILPVPVKEPAAASNEFTVANSVASISSPPAVATLTAKTPSTGVGASKWKSHSLFDESPDPVPSGMKNSLPSISSVSKSLADVQIVETPKVTSSLFDDSLVDQLEDVDQWLRSAVPTSTGLPASVSKPSASFLFSDDTESESDPFSFLSSSKSASESTTKATVASKSTFFSSASLPASSYDAALEDDDDGLGGPLFGKRSVSAFANTNRGKAGK